jgi:hypothetical protein
MITYLFGQAAPSPIAADENPSNGAFHAYYNWPSDADFRDGPE